MRQEWPQVETRSFIPAPDLAGVVALGYRELAADLFWARTLVYYGDGIARRGNLDEVDALLELVNTLDPHFRRPYRWGGYATTYRGGASTENEFWGSIRVLERGLAALPDDWELAWLLGLRYAYDLKGKTPEEQRAHREKGAEYLESAMRMPSSPADLPLVAASLRTKLGQKDRALRELREMILTTENEKTRRLLQQRYAALASENMGEEVAQAGKAFEMEWRATLPYVPASFFVLVGPAMTSKTDLETLPSQDIVSLPIDEEANETVEAKP